MTDARTKLKKRSFAVASRLRVRVERGPDAGAVVEPQAGQVTVGTSPDNDLVLGDATVSRYHLELSKTDDGIGLVDLGSRNGTFVGGIRVVRATIGPGTRLAIGSSVLAVEDGGRSMKAPEDEWPIPDVVGDSEAMRRVRQQIHTLAGVQTSVLIQGETGVGKEVIARALHDAGPRAQRPFVVVDCGSMPATLVASTLFGHERGAFTGASSQSQGAFERAAGGTVLLDEIGELPLEVQPSLLGVLERRRFVRVGGAKEIEVNARVLAATNRDLRAEVNRGSFRSDLYFRLAVARVVIPPLRERPDDIAPLVAHFCERLTGSLEMPAPLVAGIEALSRQPLAGNARELRNIVEGALVMGELSLDNTGAAAPAVDPPRATIPYRDARAQVLAEFERAYLGELIAACDGNASEAARRAKMDRPYLLTLLRRHKLR